MATMGKSRNEAFAQALAGGASPGRAWAEAGYVGHGHRARRRAADPAVKRRVAEIGREKTLAAKDLMPVIEEMMRLVKEASKLDTAAGLTAARGLLAEAARLKGLLPEPPWAPEEPPRRRLTTEEWVAKYAPPGTRRAEPAPSAGN
ncbi:MAG: hypothetical protein H0X27_11765, partial [Caulobacteraceae bacterium]|nr:hypothetical protein [Caulobacteraceae bacterium]